MELNLKFPPTVSAFMQSDARHRLIVGPFGSGKTVGSLTELPRRASMQQHSPNGKRKSRWAVVRNTMPELRDTTMKSWFDWFPNGSLGYYVSTTKTYHIKQDDMDAEICFRALDDANDVKNLLGMELTGANLEEYREIHQDIFEALDGRVGRYPRMNEGGPSWIGIWGDSNMPEEGSYWYAMQEKRDPKDVTKHKDNSIVLFKQPPAMMRMPDGTYALNPHAENLENLTPGYYEALVNGKTDDFIRVNVLVEYGRSKGGKPVHPDFNRAMHVAPGPLIPNPELLLLVAADFGLTPAMVLKQQDAFGRVLTLDEIACFDMGIERAIDEKLLPLLHSKRYQGGYEIFVTGDPSGNTAAESNEVSCVDIFRKYRRKGLGRVKMAYTNAALARREATDYFLNRLTGGRPAYQIDPRCVWLLQALEGKFMYKKTKDGRHSEEVDKNDWSHIGEANEYGDMYFQRGGRRKAENRQDFNWDEAYAAQRQSSANIYATPR